MHNVLGQNSVMRYDNFDCITKEVDDVKDLRHLRLASRTLCAVATPLL